MQKDGLIQNQRGGRKHLLSRSFFVLFFTISLNLGGFSPCAFATDPNISEAVIDANSVVELIFNVNPEVVSARYAMEAAEFQFRDFERNLSQFTPLILESTLERDERKPDENQNYNSRVGMEKEFFDGGSVSTGIGHRGRFGDAGSARGQFVDTAVTFPVSGSNTTLRRITDRSRQENEMFNTRLEYVDTLRDNIQEAQWRYISLVERIKRVSYLEQCVADYHRILETPRARTNAAERRQIAGEIQNMQSDIIQTTERISVSLMDLQMTIGLEQLSLSQIEDFDLEAENCYGNSYLTRPLDELLAEAYRNDIRIRVLENARKNSLEKRDLAIKGKWDIFVDLDGRLDFAGGGDLRDEDGYLAASGLRADKIDSVLLRYSLGRALSEIKKYDALIKKQKLETKNQIQLQLMIAKSRRKQYEQVLKNIKSRRAIYQQKLEDYVDGKGNVDNLLAARKHLLWTIMEIGISLREFYENVTWLDHACGVYLAKLGIELQTTSTKQQPSGKPERKRENL